MHHSNFNLQKLTAIPSITTTTKKSNIFMDSYVCFALFRWMEKRREKKVTANPPIHE